LLEWEPQSNSFEFSCTCLIKCVFEASTLKLSCLIVLTHGQKKKLFLQTQMMITQWILQLKWHMGKRKKSSHSKNGFEIICLAMNSVWCNIIIHVNSYSWKFVHEILLWIFSKGQVSIEFFTLKGYYSY
jgi:hypothetical protein